MTSSTASVTNIDPIVEDVGISVQVADRSTSQYLTKRQFMLHTIYRVNDYEDRCSVIMDNGIASIASFCHLHSMLASKKNKRQEKSCC
jgi:hypothetical protein